MEENTNSENKELSPLERADFYTRFQKANKIRLGAKKDNKVPPQTRHQCEAERDELIWAAAKVKEDRKCTAMDYFNAVLKLAQFDWPYMFSRMPDKVEVDGEVEQVRKNIFEIKGPKDKAAVEEWLAKRLA